MSDTTALASLDDLAVRIPGGIPDDEEARAQAALDDASALVHAIAGDTDLLVDEDATPSVPASVVAVVCNAARRVLDNPFGRSSESQGNASWSNSATSGVFLTEDERRTIRRAVGSTDWTALPLSHHYRLDGSSPRHGDADRFGVWVDADDWL